MLLALFLLETAAGLYLFLPLVGRRNAGVKFYRLILIVCGSLLAGAALAHGLAGARALTLCDGGLVVLTLIVYMLLRYPKRLVFRGGAGLLAAGLLAQTIQAFDAAVTPPTLAVSIAGALTSTALLGSTNLAMLLGHWYLVVRGMPIDPLKRLSWATLAAALAKVLAVGVVIFTLRAGGLEDGSPLHRLMITNGVFFWMRAGWGLVGPLALYPMIWGTVKIRSTMAATGILYVAVVAVVIGEVLGNYLSAVMHLPL